jgi:hypothetical protein
VRQACHPVIVELHRCIFTHADVHRVQARRLGYLTTYFKRHSPLWRMTIVGPYSCWSRGYDRSEYSAIFRSSVIASSSSHSPCISHQQEYDETPINVTSHSVRARFVSAAKHSALNQSIFSRTLQICIIFCYGVYRDAATKTKALYLQRDNAFLHFPLPYRQISTTSPVWRKYCMFRRLAVIDPWSWLQNISIILEYPSVSLIHTMVAAARSGVLSNLPQMLWGLR